MLYCLSPFVFPFPRFDKECKCKHVDRCGVFFFSKTFKQICPKLLKFEEKYLHMCVSTRLVWGTHFQFSSVLFFFSLHFFFLKNHLHNNSCECTYAATDDGPEMIQRWCYEAILTVIQLDFAELQLRKWALKPEHVNICQPIDLLPIISLYMLILFTNGAYSCLVSLRTWAFTAKLHLYEWYAVILEEDGGHS